MQLEMFTRLPVMGIVRGIKEDEIEPLVATVIEAGLPAIEITMNTEGAAHLIEKMVECAAGRIMIGAGTVLTMQELEQASAAGAGFIVSPTFIPDVVAYCVRHEIPIFPGALTPQEIFTAWQAGARMVKVFPAKFFGPEYFKEIKGPFRDIPLLACGGVSSATIQQYFRCGASAVAFGGSIFRREWLEKREFSRVGQAIKELIAAYRAMFL
jgi:2-dehydro-3-deoxyphosphogluconate aldolase / (4S)-4-hydroxy-2-oxoglutarate aldolase